MNRNLEKFFLLMWKNWVLQYRKPIQSIIEIFAPVLFSVLLVIIRSLSDPKPHDAVIYEPFCTLPVPGLCGMQNVPFGNHNRSLYGNYKLVYSPETEAVNKVMSHFNLVFEEVKGLPNSSALETYYVSHDNDTFAAIEFDDNLGSNFPNDVNVNIRFPAELRVKMDLMDPANNWKTNLIFPVYSAPGPRSPNNYTGASPNYFAEGFLAIQHLLSMFLIFEQNSSLPQLPEKLDKAAWMQWFIEMKDNPAPLINMRRFPNAKWYEDALLTPLEAFVGVIFMLSFVYTCINTVRAITTEKEKQLKEAMKIMGLPNWLHWTAWFAKVFILLIISIVLMTVLLKVKWFPNSDFSVFTYASPTVLLFFLFFYVCATITFCFAISVFFSKANTAATIAGLAWFLSYAPYLFLAQQYDSLSLAAKLVSSIGSNTAMAFGFQIVLMYEGIQEGVQWSNMFKPANPDDTFSLGLVIVMLAIDSIIYLLIALYVEQVIPGEYGIPQPWYFPFTAKFWCGLPRSTGVENFEDDNATDGEYFEKEPKGLQAGIKIRNLRKVFNSKVAVRNLSLNMFENQITVLLGHNGAGKTTTMSMLTGMFPPTSGTAIIEGYDIRTEIQKVRNSLGLCPQHNVIFDELTVAEHLYFFSKLKGMSGGELDNEINKFIQLLDFESKRNARSKTLSGGMKRKLCVGMALCGKSKVVMLDEPTAGMDPSARRTLWDFLEKQKEGRTVLLTTHFMDEADLLGDRIAIMAGGELQCCGSSFFLKKKYGAGYHLIMDKLPSCDPQRVTALLRNYVPTIEVENNIGSELTYLLAENQSSVFEPMLSDLERNSKQLGINGYGISLTTLEEVFMKVGADHGQEEFYNNNATNKQFESNDFKDSTVIDRVDINLGSSPLSSFEFLKNQLLAMFMKRLLSIWRSWLLLFIQVLMPVAFLIIAMMVLRSQNVNGNLPAMSLTLEKYDSPITLVENSTQSDWAEEYVVSARSAGSNINYTSSIIDQLLTLTEHEPSIVRKHYLTGATFDIKGNFDLPLLTAWFNNDAYHTPAQSLGTILNAVYKKMIGCEDCKINFFNKPLPYSTNTKIDRLKTGNNLGFQLAFNLGFSMAFVSSFYVLFVIRERQCKSKHLQFVSGVKVYIFWTCTFVSDFVTFLFTVCCYIITLVCFQEDGFSTPEEIGRMVLILFYFGWAFLPMVYLAAYLFDIPSTGYTRMTLFSVFTGVVAFLVVQILVSPGLDLEDVGKALHWVFLVIPHYSLATGVSNVYKYYSYHKICDYIIESCLENFPDKTYDFCFNNIPQDIQPYCQDEDYYKWEDPGIGRNILFSIVTGVVLFAILLIIEYEVFSKVIYLVQQKIYSREPTENAEEDDDVKAEKVKIRNTPQNDLFSQYTLVLRDLTKYYGNFNAVNGLCLGVKKYECFGLLGVNGAGKTSTFKMMTGDTKISYGDGYVNGISIKRELNKVQKIVGYCPQFDALLDDLTARETLVMFCLLRGIRSKDCNMIAEGLARDFDFERHLDKKVKELSGGNKRKLSTSIALIGDPPVVFLDEPTTGMDPATKRYLWNALCEVRDKGKCIVLTSHSMDECEALCTRLAIMVNGNFKCIGSTQHLKNKFAEGYTITIKTKKLLSTQELEGIERFIHENFPSSTLREKHQELLTFYVTDKSTPWSRMFGILEAEKKRNANIEDYSLGQSSLEQVFLTFTKLQS